MIPLKYVGSVICNWYVYNYSRFLKLALYCSVDAVDEICHVLHSYNDKNSLHCTSYFMAIELL